MSRVLVYCGFLANEKITTPELGVDAARVNVLAQDRLRLLWSEVAWPFAQAGLQRNAVEFHTVVEHVFRQTAVIPFRLLSVFDNVAVFEKFATEHAAEFIADLERLRDCVQMEAVVYLIRPRESVDSSSGRAYLQQKAEMLRLSSEHAAQVRDAISATSTEVRVREVKNGTRIFALVQRGQEDRFRRAVEAIPVPERVSRRLSGPWPPAEFLSDTVKAPKIAGQP
jgi:Gas vesicle synthesis protein GvpL/GvpF